MQLLLTASFQAGAGGVQLGGAVTGVAHEFSDALGKISDQRGKLRGVVISSTNEPREVIRHATVMRLQNAGKTAPDESKTSADRPARPAYSGRVHGEVEWSADPGNPKLLREPGDGIEHGRQQVRVLVRVEMRRRDAGRNDLFDLGAELVVNANLAGGQC